VNRLELRAQFQDILNRTDCSEDQADKFLDFGLRRSERVLRTPLQKQLLDYPIPEGYPEYITVPAGYLGLEWLRINGYSPRRISPANSCDDGFWFEKGQIHFRPAIAEGDTIRLSYYAETSLDAGDDEEVSPTSISIPDVIIYAALVFAADTFVDERKQSWKDTLKELIAEVQDMSDRDSLVQGVISNPYTEGSF